MFGSSLFRTKSVKAGSTEAANTSLDFFCVRARTTIEDVRISLAQLNASGTNFIGKV